MPLRSFLHFGGRKKHRLKVAGDGASSSDQSTRAGSADNHSIPGDPSSQSQTSIVAQSSGTSLAVNFQTLPQQSQCRDQLSKKQQQQSDSLQSYSECYQMWNTSLAALAKTNSDVFDAKYQLAGSQSDQDISLLVRDISTTLTEKLQSQKRDGTIPRAVKKSLDMLNKFTPVIDTAVSFDPAHVALPWAAIRFALTCINSKSEIDAKLLEGVALASTVLVQSELNQQLYMAPDLDLRPPEKILERLKESIINSYTQLQLFLAFAIRRGQGITEALTSPFKVGTVQELVQKMEESQQGLLLAADQCERCCNLTERGNIQTLLVLAQEFRSVLRDVALITSALEKVEQEEMIRILNWISPIQYNQHQISVRERRTADTCNWLLRHPAFLDWEEASHSSVLWLHGYAGTGKTLLTSKVIDHLKSTYDDSQSTLQQSDGFAFFYCNRIEEQRRDFSSVLRSYVRQLSSPAGNTQSMWKNLREAYVSCRRDASTLTLPACQRHLAEAIGRFGSTILVLDALDECEPDTCREIIEAFDELRAAATKPLKIFISGRPDPHVRTYLESWPVLEIDATNNKRDIESFVQDKIAKNKKWQKKIREPVRQNVVTVLCTRSQGMFQWANLQIQQLFKANTEMDILERLGKLPPDLEAAYDEIYREKAQNPHEKFIMEHSCLWVMYTSEPLSSQKLVHLLNWSFVVGWQQHPSSSRILSPSQSSSLLPTEVVVGHDMIEDVCSNLLIFDTKSKRWRVSHLSVAEYLECREFFLPQEAHRRLATISLQSLLPTNISFHGPARESSSTDQSSWDETDEEGEEAAEGYYDSDASLADILSMYVKEPVYDIWPMQIRHYQRSIDKSGADPDATLVRLLEGLLGHPADSSAEFRWWYDRPRLDDDPLLRGSLLHNLKDMRPNTRSLKLMCYLPVFSLLRKWWSDPDVLLASEEDRDELLVYAAQSGCLELCRILIKGGVSVNHILATRSSIPTALAGAVKVGDVDVAQLLLKHGANVNLQFKIPEWLHDITRPCSALRIAVGREGSLRMVQLLINSGADIIGNGYYPAGSALAEAARSRNLEAAQYLVETCGANVNQVLSHGYYGNALIAAACFSNNLETVQYLVEKGGADVKQVLSHGNYGNALIAAASSGDLKTVQYLVEKCSADVNQLPGHGWHGTALIAAADYGNIEIVQYLVEKGGADVNQLPGHGHRGTALIAAADYGSLEIVQYLVEKGGADVNQLPGHGHRGTALIAAADYENLEIVQYLVEKGGADVDQLPGHGWHGTALIAAADSGNLETVLYLIEKGGAEVNPVLSHGWFRNALIAAASSRKLEAIQCLVEKGGANVNQVLSHGHFGNALIAAACSSKNLDTVQYLVEKGGANVNQVLSHGDYGNALIAASRSSKNLDTVQYLVEKGGADVNQVLSHGYYGNALIAAACSSKNLDTVQYLVQKGGADVNQVLSHGDYGNALIAAACSSKNLDTVQYLVEKGGADVNQVLSHGYYGNALIAAAHSWKTLETVQYLVEKGGADVNKVLNYGTCGNALVAAANSRFENNEKVEYLIERHRADFSAELFASVALRSCHLGTVEFLISKGAAADLAFQSVELDNAIADLRIDFPFISDELAEGRIMRPEGASEADEKRDEEGEKYDTGGVEHEDQLEKFQYLIEEGAKVNSESATSHFGSPLAAAAGLGSHRLAHLLLDKGADVNLTLRHGPYGTALRAAAYWGRRAMVKRLLKAGARWHKQDSTDELFANPAVEAAVEALVLANPKAPCARILERRRNRASRAADWENISDILRACGEKQGHIWDEDEAEVKT